VERSVNGGSFTLAATVGVNATAWSQAGLLPETTYTYRVRAFNSGGSSPFTAEAGVITPPNPPSAPTGLSGVALNSASVALTWSDTSSTEVGFRIYRWDAGSGVYAPIHETGANATGYTDVSVAANTRYVYYVVAFNVTGASSATNKASVTTPAASP
jgi:hypothetical protein